jgi:hypothetical protein
MLGQGPEPVPVNAIGAPTGSAPPFERAWEYPISELQHYGVLDPRIPRLPPLTCCRAA